MAQVAVNKNGTEIIGDYLVRGYYNKYGSLVIEGDYFNMDESRYTEYVYPYQNSDTGGWEDIAIELPQGTIEKIIGRRLTFEDGRIEI